MNKTLTINISGIIFHIEEDAYDSLSKYLATIKGYFSHTDGGNEIMSDIEARIAELLQGRIGPSKQVILMSDVEFVMSTMGKPEDFGGEPSRQENNEQAQEEPGQKIKRRLFRNPDDKAIGGVCGGLAAYLDIETVWVRLAMFVLLFFGGLSFWVYIILWIVMPEAKTTADKFAMRGEQANINNIIKNFKEEAEDLKNRFKSGNYGDSVRNNLSNVLNVILNVAGRLIGLFFILLGGVLLFAYVLSLMGASVMAGDTDISLWRDAIFDSSSDYILGVFAFAIVVGIPVLSMIYGGVKLLFRIHYTNRWLNLALGVLWVIGIVVGFCVTIMTLKQFNELSRVREEFTLRGTGDTLVVKMNRGSANIKAMNFDNQDDIEEYVNENRDGYFFGRQGREQSVISYAELDVERGDSDSIEVEITRSARGTAKKDAIYGAKTIQYSYRQNKNELIFDEVFVSNLGTKFRKQEVNIKIRLPKGKVIYFDESVKYMLDDVSNTTNTWEGHMVSRRWQMTDRGLQCIDCENLGEDEGEEHHPRSRHKNKVTINRHGIHVNGDQTEVKIDEHGIRIKTPEKEVEVKDDKAKNKRN